MSAVADPQQLGKYKLRELVGGSGIAEVWKAYAPSLRRYVAIKILHPDLQNDPSFTSRFKRDARQVASLHHPNIARVYDYQVAKEDNAVTSSLKTCTLAYIVMDFVEGTSLASLIRATSRMGKFPSPTEIVHLFATLASAVDYAHEHGAVFGDIKPTNIALDEQPRKHTSLGEPVLTSFGIAKLLGTTPDVMSRWGHDTPLYISPEQAMGYAADAASDIYSLGVILYEMLTGRTPFQMNAPETILQQHIHATPIPPSLLNPTISPALSTVILRSLEKEPTKRFPTASALVAALALALEVPLPNSLSPSTSPSQPDSPGSPAASILPGLPTLPTLAASQTSAPAPTPDYSPLLSSPASSYLSTRRSTRVIPSHPINATPPSSPPTGNTISTNLACKVSSLRTNTPSFSPPSPDSPALPPPTPPHPTSSAVPFSPHEAYTSQAWRGQGKFFAGEWHIAVLLTLLALLMIASLGAFIVLAKIQQPIPEPQTVGHVSFLSSGQIVQNNRQGLADQVLIELQHIPLPAAGKAYYAWLLSDLNQDNSMWVPLGKVVVRNNTIHYLYTGDAGHDDMLADCSRFLITEENASKPQSNPFREPAAWRYYATLSQKHAGTGGHFSMLDDLRHLLVQAPELQSLGLSGGMTVWLLRNIEEINKWALIARDSWASNPFAIQQELVNILFYLDGECTWQYLHNMHNVPPTVPTTPENPTIAHIAHFALLNPCLQEQEEQPQSLQNIFGNTPHDYLDHMLFHLAAVAHAPGTTPETQALVKQITMAITYMKGQLTQLHQNALQLLSMNDNQLKQNAGLALLNDLETEAVGALAGNIDPGSGHFQAGASWIYQNTQQLAKLNVTIYTM